MLSRKPSDNIWLATAMIVFLAGVIVSIFQLAKFLKADLPAQLSYVSDDTFYYLKICLNRAHLGMWSFDGINATTGFHLLHAFLLILIIKIFGVSGINLMIGAVLISFLAYCGSSIMVFLISKRILDKTYAFLFCGIWIGNLYNIRGYLTGMEFGLVLLMSTSFFLVLTVLLDERSSSNTGIRTPLNLSFLFLISFLLCLTRTDLVFLGVVFSLVLLLCYFLLRATDPSRALLLRTTGLITLAGTVISMVTVSAFCYTVTGQFMQNSGKIKRIWAHIDAAQNMVSNYDITVIAVNFVRVSGNILRYTVLVTYQPFVMISLGALICYLLVVILRRVKSLTSTPKIETVTILFIGACCHMLITIAYYSVSLPGLQPRWYYAKVFWSLLFVLLYIIFCFRAVDFKPKLFWTRASFDGKWFIFPIFVIVLVNNVIRIASFEGSWKHQKEMYAAAKMLQQLPKDAQVGSWNAGILGYFSDRTVINLDGLVNSGIEDYARRRRLDQYIEDNNIEYIADHNRMVSKGIQSLILPQSWSSTHLVRLYSIPASEDSRWWEGYSIWEVVGDTFSNK
jgi:hypothetical protein